MSGAGDGRQDRHPLFVPLVFVGGLVFGVGLAVSRMARPEIVLDFLQLDDLGLVFVMGGAAVVVGLTFGGARLFGDHAPLTGRVYERRLKDMDANVLRGGVIFGVGWGISGLCPGAAYASVGVGNYPVLLGIGAMFLGAYAQGFWRHLRSPARVESTAD